MRLPRIPDYEFKRIKLAIAAVSESKDVALVASEHDAHGDISLARRLVMRYQGLQHLFENGMTEAAWAA